MPGAAADPPAPAGPSARGTIYVVATPIGNLEDITLRALRVLREVDLVAAEDTRRTRVLLEQHGIRARLIAYHDHVESARSAELVERALRGESIALVSDAGTPLIADPGYRLLRAAADAGVRVVPVPGASSPIALLSCAALPTDRFTFVGFLSARPSQRRHELQGLVDRRETLVFLETARRIAGSLTDMAAVLGDRPAVLGRELTKRFEDVRRGTLRELLAQLPSAAPEAAGAGADDRGDRGDADDADDADGAVGDDGEGGAPARLRGEIVLAVGGATAAREERAPTPTELDAFLRARLDAGESVAAAARAAAQQLGVPRREAYLRATAVKRPM